MDLWRVRDHRFCQPDWNICSQQVYRCYVDIQVHIIHLLSLGRVTMTKEISAMTCAQPTTNQPDNKSTPDILKSIQ